MKTTQLHIRLTERENELIRRMAERRHRTATWVVLNALSLYSRWHELLDQAERMAWRDNLKPGAFRVVERVDTVSGKKR